MVRNLFQLYNTGRVRRFHTVPDYSGGAAQTTAEHQWGVALIVLEIYRRAEQEPRPKFLEFVLLHDAEEAMTGDFPSPSKWYFDKLADGLDLAQRKVRKSLGIDDKLTAEETNVLNWADALELYAYAYAKVKSGNQSYQDVVINIHRHMVEDLEGSKSFKVNIFRQMMIELEG